MNRCFIACFIICCLLLPLPLFSEEDYEAYSENEFPQWMDDLRRFEIISIGIFPFALFFTSFGYDIYRYADSGFNLQYAPGPFRTSGGGELTSNEQVAIFVSSAVVALICGAVDYLIVSSARE